jgi:hypothetical protein
MAKNLHLDAQVDDQTVKIAGGHARRPDQVDPLVPGAGRCGKQQGHQQPNDRLCFIRMHLSP